MTLHAVQGAQQGRWLRQWGGVWGPLHLCSWQQLQQVLLAGGDWLQGVRRSRVEVGRRGVKMGMLPVVEGHWAVLQWQAQGLGARAQLWTL